MNLIEELDKLQQLHRSGALSDDEFAAAKSQILGQGALAPPAASGVADRLQAIAHHNEVAALDREWEIARESYMITGKHGHRYIPTQAGSALLGVALGLFGAYWTAMAFGTWGALIGVLIIAVGVGTGLYSFSRATKYSKAEQRYQEQRAELLASGPRAQNDRSTADQWWSST